MSDESIDVRGTQRIELENIDLDPLNPRLVVDAAPSQGELILQLFEEESLDELVKSFVEFGYFDEEPIVVVPESERYIVVEGNRRIATLKLLLDSSLRESLDVRGWPKLTKEQSDRLKFIPAVIYEDRNDVLPYLGFRHITGVRKWAFFQRARFVADMVDQGHSIAQIQENLGDESQAVKKLYQVYVVFSQLLEDADFVRDRATSRLSLLEVALGQRSIKRFLGLPHNLPKEQVEHLVDDDHLDNLKELARWIFGGGDAGPVVSDSREIPRKLSKVIEDESALKSLREKGDLDAAMERLGGERVYLFRRLAAAERVVRDVSELAPNYSNDDEIVARVQFLRSAVDELLVKFHRNDGV